MNFVVVAETPQENLAHHIARPCEPVAIAPKATTPATPRPVRALKSASERPAERSSSVGTNKRWSERTQVWRDGMIGCAGRDPVLCKVLNLSKFGALIEVTDQPAADAFVLVFVANRVRSEVSCIVRWRKGARIDVHFAGLIHTTVDIRKIF